MSKRAWVWLVAAAWGTSVLLVLALLLREAGLASAAAACDAARWLSIASVAFVALARLDRRVVAFALGVLLPLYASAAVQLEVRGPAHYHAAGTPAHHHHGIEHHHHGAPSDAVEVDSPGPHAADSAQNERKSGVLDYLGLAAAWPAPSISIAVADAAAPASDSVVPPLFERPPRAL